MSFGYQVLGFGSLSEEKAVVSASGNTATTVGAYTVQSYTGSGNFTVTGELACDILCVAGGGSGSSGHYGSGAGAGGMRTNSSTLSGSYTITIGGGGAEQGTFNQHGNKGSNSSVGSLLVCTGGGKGAYSSTGFTGGSGSVGSLSSNSCGSGNEGSYSPA